MDASKSEPPDPCTLSIHRAFVIRVFGRVDAELAGQVEHVVSGDASQFRSADELLQFIRRVLRVYPPDNS
ncbi:MAG TPA: hypothetical protein VFS23_33910 [Vicinamibacterales bacterium]|nr:hypothetical protein [Vicinamibacterales bacterium]